MNTHDTLLAFSEWLDTHGLIPVDGDNRTHDDLAREFIEQWEADRDKATLAGRVIVQDSVMCVDTMPIAEIRSFGDAAPVASYVDGPLLGLATTAELVSELAARVEVAETIGEDWPGYKTVDGHPEGEKVEVGPHSRACGIRKHEHGSECHSNCPTCGGRS